MPSALAGEPTESEKNESENSSTEYKIPYDAESVMELSSDCNASGDDDISKGEKHNDSDRDEGAEEDLDQFLYDTILRLVEIKGQARFS